MSMAAYRLSFSLRLTTRSHGLGVHDLEPDDVGVGHVAVINQVIFPAQRVPFIGERDFFVCHKNLHTFNQNIEKGSAAADVRKGPSYKCNQIVTHLGPYVKLNSVNII